MNSNLMWTRNLRLTAAIVSMALGCALLSAAPVHSQTGEEALFEAVVMADSERIEFLVGMGGNIDAVNEDGWTALMFSVAALKPAITQQLLELGADPQRQSRTGMDALRYAGLYGCAECVEILTGQGVDPNSQDPSGWSALHYAASAGHLVVVEQLLKAGSDVGLRTESGDTALHIAVAKSLPRTVAILMKHGADADVENELGITPRRSSQWREDPEIYQMLSGAPDRS